MSAVPAPSGAVRGRRWWVLGAAAVVLAVLVVVAARLILASTAGETFLRTYSGAAPRAEGTPVGFPAWVAWQHGLNAVFLLFTVRSGWRIHRAGRPSTFWTRRNDGRIRTRNAPIRIAIDLWSHYVADTLWVLNGVLFVLLAAVSGQWLRIVPTDIAIVPNAVSAGLQYAAFQWPSENGWVNYNALQQLSYCAVVYLAGPVAVLTGLRAAPGLAARLRPLDARFSVALSKRIHWWTMWFLVAFTVVHVALVLLTGAIRNLNHMYAVNDGTGPAGLIVFAVSLALVAGLVLAIRPPVVCWVAARTGTVLHRPPRPPRTPPAR